MFAYLSGRLHRKTTGAAVLDVHGVGYQVQIPLSTFYELGEEGDETSLRITTQVREDAIVLFGFHTEAEQVLFQHLISVSGVGPRMALSVLSGMPVPEVVEALAEGDAARLRAIPGVGRKTADRLVMELKDRVQSLGSASPTRRVPGDAIRDDVVSALVNLGYPSSQAEKATAQVLGEVGEAARFEAVLRDTLRRLHR